ncbi:hypothetical protein H9P43_009387 [Blastocladiella emersonii ATCC 22665]|nr:hypothetical protein H9P43_009387 [Blastocladiella emersonii ATCC 22665]
MRLDSSQPDSEPGESDSDSPTTAPTAELLPAASKRANFPVRMDILVQHVGDLTDPETRPAKNAALLALLDAHPETPFAVLNDTRLTSPEDSRYFFGLDNTDWFRRDILVPCDVEDGRGGNPPSSREGGLTLLFRSSISQRLRPAKEFPGFALVQPVKLPSNRELVLILVHFTDGLGGDDFDEAVAFVVDTLQQAWFKSYPVVVVGSDYGGAYRGPVVTNRIARFGLV